MPEILTEGNVIAILKKSINDISSCMTLNGCMGSDGRCQQGKNPVNCFNELDAARNSLELVEQAIQPAGGEAWTSQASRREAHNPPR